MHTTTLYQLVLALRPLLLISLLFIGATVLFTRYETAITELVATQSVLSAGLYVLVFIISIVAVPISAVPLIALGVGVWGVLITTVLSVIGWTIGAFIAFTLARLYGRPLVARLISPATLSQFERLVPEHHLFGFILLTRSVLPFDGASYVFGLVPHISTRTHIVATFLGLIPFCLFMAYLGTLPPLYLLGGLVLLGIGVSLSVASAWYRHIT